MKYKATWPQNVRIWVWSCGHTTVTSGQAPMTAGEDIDQPEHSCQQLPSGVVCVFDQAAHIVSPWFIP